jgi:hypothetical protein
LEAQKESALVYNQSVLSSLQQVLDLYQSTEAKHFTIQQETETRRLRFLHVSQLNTSFESKVRDLQTQLVKAYRTNEELGRKMICLDKEKSDLRSNIAALEHLLDTPGFKAPKTTLQQTHSNVQLSQGAELLEDVCVMCSGPLYGKVRKCKECGGRMHGHCVTNKCCLCISCMG